MSELWVFITGLIGTIIGHIFGKIVTDSLPDMHYKKIIAFAKKWFVAVRFLVVFKVLLFLKKHHRISPELEKQLNLVYLLAGIIILFAALQKWSEKNNQNVAIA